MLARNRLIVMMASLLVMVSISLFAQWNNSCGSEVEPKFALLGLTDGTLALVRFSDWSIQRLGNEVGKGATNFGVVYYCGSLKAVACTGAGYPRQLLVLDLRDGSVHYYETKDIPGAKKNLVYFWIDSRDPSALFVASSDQASYYDDVILEKNPLLACSRYDTRTGAWSTGAPTYDRMYCSTLPSGKEDTPGLMTIIRAQSAQDKQELSVSQIMLYWTKARTDLEATLKKGGIIRENDFQSRFATNTDAILYIGQTYQLCRANGRLSLTSAGSGVAKVLTESPKALVQANPLLLNPDTVALISEDVPGFKGHK